MTALMKVVIVEDEMPAANRLKKMLDDSTFDIDVIKVLTSVRESVDWFRDHELPDLMLMDIELSDGLSLDLIETVKINCPIIFITAYNEYWQEAFEHYGIEYLLKPLKKERLYAALNKFEDLRDFFASRYQSLANATQKEKKFKDRFLVKRGKEYASIKSEDISCFYATHKLVCLVTRNRNKFLLDTSLSEIEKEVNSAIFFRINRKYLVNINSIKKISAIPKSKLLIEIAPEVSEELIVSADNSGKFKKWIRDRN
jgi:DNA-binding LytR/AlgR family response regulator